MNLKNISDITSCLSDFDPNALSVEATKKILHALLEPVVAQEKLALREALDRVLAREVVSGLDVPAHDNSAMDGYAFQGQSLNAAGDTLLKVVGTAYAGNAFTGEVPRGSCVKIMTGAVMPQGCDTVVPQELCSASGQTIRISPNTLKTGDNRRFKGEDLQKGGVALPAGRILRPSDIGLLASLGVGEVWVKRKLRVAFFSTGDELRSIGEALDEGCVYDSNRYTLYGMLKRLRCVDLIDMGVVKDDPAVLKATMLEAARCADAIVTSGGVSVGEADHTKAVMKKLGDVQFWKIAMRPGRPMAVGHIKTEGKQTLLLGLPGNPVAVMVTFYAFAREVFLRMAGADVKPLPTVSAKLTSGVRKKAGRTEYQRVLLNQNESGEWLASLTGQQGSGVLRSMADADGLLVLAHEQESLNTGDVVQVLAFDHLI